MPEGRVDYDRVAPTYNRRFDANGQRGVTTALRELAQALDAESVLEVGCGTGYWLSGLKGVVDQLYGLDLSQGMLQQAQTRGAPLYLTRGRAGQVPFPDDVFDLVFCVNAIHHFDQPCAFVGEAARVLRPGGALAVVGMDPHNGRDRWYVYRYFPGTRATDLRRFPSWGTILDWMVSAGADRVRCRVVERIQDIKVGRAVLADPFLEKNAASQLALLSDEAYADGIRRIETALARAEEQGEALLFPSEITLGMLVGWF